MTRTADFYSPLPVLAEVAETRELWDRPSELMGVDYDLEAMKSLLEALVETHGGEFGKLPPIAVIAAAGMPASLRYRLYSSSLFGAT